MRMKKGQTTLDWAEENGLLDQFIKKEMNTDFLPFEEAREIVIPFGFTGVVEYRKAQREGKLPRGMPNCPNVIYKNKGWISWKSFLNNEMLPFEEARETAQSFKFSGKKEYQKAKKEGKLPKGLPSTPNEVYKNSGWVDWYDWLGKKR